MRSFIDLAKRFHADERGVFAIMFALLAIVLIATAGAVVDFTAVEQARTRAQLALDSAALGLQPTIFTAGVTETTIKPKALQLVTERLNDASIAVVIDSAAINTTDGTLRINASITVPTAFVSLVGFPTIRARVVSEATRKRLNLEVAMVLDNSISMDQSSRMTNLKLAARCATDVLFNNTTDCSTTAKLNTADALAPTNANTRIAIVPFTEFVNVGTGNKTASWMDQTGVSTVSKTNFDSDDNETTAFNTSVNRFNLYTAIGQTWSGCVEARNHTTGAGGLYYDTSDITPDSSIADSLFTPIFAPDQPDTGGYGNDYLNDRPSACTNKDQGSWVKTSTKTNCTSNGNNNSGNYSSCSSTATVTTVQKDQNGANVSPVAATEPASVNGQAKLCVDSYVGTKTSSSPNRYKNVYTRSCSYSFSDRELQERLCKYASTNTVSLSSNFQSGPNADCGVATLPLTATKADVISKIAAMGPDGATNIHQGVMWGFHALSPTAPFTEAGAYGNATAKVMIVMTDGENTASSNETSKFTGSEWYLAYGYPYSGRLVTGDIDAMQTEMDNRTKTTCQNAKNAGITVYTIGLSPPTTATEDMLKACATDTAKAYFPTNSADLVSMFKKIAEQLSNLRLSK